ncbi:MAG: helix-turn-helix transcriptional regulator [Pseudomonadota bacterium]
MANYFHSRLVALQRIALADDTPNLTPREIECLTWAGVGKTDQEIGLIIGRSPRTAHAHIENAMKKLGVHTRLEAVLRAFTMGLIRL